MEHIALHIVDIWHLLVDNHLTRAINELDKTILLYTGQPIREHPCTVVLWFNDHLTSILTEVPAFLSITEADECVFPQRIRNPGDMLNQLLARALIVYISLTILCVMEVDIAVYVLRVIAILIITIMTLEPMLVGHFNTRTDNGKCKECHDNCSAGSKQSPDTLGELSVSLIPEQSKEPSK